MTLYSGLRDSSMRPAMNTAGIAALGALLLASCTGPTRRADALARDLGFQKQIDVGDGFRHVVYRNAALTENGILHVYIDGDGTPYRRPGSTASDPTPHNPLMLRLMALDPAHSIYMGRPCYFGLYRDDACSPSFWTLRRYGTEVLESMQAALLAEMAEARATRVALFGHSGGGTLAVLLAERMNVVTRVITLGANLDIAAWSDLHHFTPLLGSINPVEEPRGRVALQILHVVGENDTNTPAVLVQAAAGKRGEPVRVVAHFDHTCCWESLWPALLRESP